MIGSSVSQTEKILRSVETFINNYSLKMKIVKSCCLLNSKGCLRTNQSLKLKKEDSEAWKAAIFYNFTNPQGRSHKSLGDKPCAKSSRNLWTPMVQEFEDFAASQGITNHEALNLFIKECNEVWKIKKPKDDN